MKVTGARAADKQPPSPLAFDKMSPKERCSVGLCRCLLPPVIYSPRSAGATATPRAELRSCSIGACPAAALCLGGEGQRELPAAQLCAGMGLGEFDLCTLFCFQLVLICFNDSAQPEGKTALSFKLGQSKHQAGPSSFLRNSHCLPALLQHGAALATVPALHSSPHSSLQSTTHSTLQSSLHSSMHSSTHSTLHSCMHHCLCSSMQTSSTAKQCRQHTELLEV